MLKENKRNYLLKILIIGAIILLVQLISNTNYKVLAVENINQETQVKTEKVSKKKVSKLKIKLNSTLYTYTGGERNVPIKAYDGSKKLKKGKDYTVTYKNNVKIGIAKVTIKGKGNYTGSITKSYYILPQTSKIKSVMFNSKFTKATITWKKDPKATGYAIYMSESKNGEYKKIKHITKKSITTYTKTRLDPDKMYYFKVRAFKTINKNGKKKNIYSKNYSKAKSNTGLISEVTLTSKGSGSNRNHNLKLASKKINGLVLRPGQTFNWFTVVGPASKRNGYKVAIVFENGKSVRGYGGGVCQVSTTLYQASKKVGLRIVERYTHSKPVSYTTSGKDATVAYGSRNLRIRNNKNYSIRIVTTSKGGSTTCKIYRVAD